MKYFRIERIKRAIEILSTDNPYPKVKRLIRAIALVNHEGVGLIKADLDAMFADLLDDTEPITIAEFHKESGEAVQSILADESLAIQTKEIRESVAAGEKMLNQIEHGRQILPDHIQKAVAGRNGGRR